VHNYLYRKANRLVLEMETTSLELLDIMAEATSAVASGITDLSQTEGKERG